MIQLTNKREQYDVTNEDSNLKLQGTFVYSDDKRVTDFNGWFYSLEGESKGNFYYLETDVDTINKSINDFPKEMGDKGCELLDATVAAIKAELNK